MRSMIETQTQGDVAGADLPSARGRRGDWMAERLIRVVFPESASLRLLPRGGESLHFRVTNEEARPPLHQVDLPRLDESRGRDSGHLEDLRHFSQSK